MHAFPEYKIFLVHHQQMSEVPHSPRVSRLKAFFSGHVQGVGFRYQTVAVAKGYEVSGWVRNLADGRVEMLAEGERSEVKALFDAVAEEMRSYIKSADYELSEGTRTCRGFRITQ